MKHFSIRPRAAVLCAFFAAPLLLLADQDGGQGRDFSVTFSGCTEAIGFGPIASAKAQPFVPAGFVLAPVGPGSAGLVVRASNCQSMQVDGKQEGPGSIAQIGVAVIPPDGTGDVNNYTVVYVTSSERLAQRLRRAGLPATSDRGLLYEFTRGTPSNTGELYAAAQPDEQPAFFLNGTVSDAVPPSFPFTANWWYQDGARRIKMSTGIGQLRYGAGAQLRAATGRAIARGDRARFETGPIDRRQQLLELQHLRRARRVRFRNHVDHGEIESKNRMAPARGRGA